MVYNQYHEDATPDVAHTILLRTDFSSDGDQEQKG
jgi:hypothetical protein